MPLSEAHVARLADLARLELSEDEITRLASELSTIIDYFEQLKAVDTSDIEPQPIAPLEHAPLRKDRAGPSLPREEALANAPDTDGKYFRAPEVIRK